MKFLAIIPARSGSKSVKNKNMAMLNKKPLIFFTLREVKRSVLKKNFIISTNDQKLINYLVKNNISNYICRPRKYSKDNTTSIQLLKFLKKQLKNFNGYDAIVYLQPTSPFRTFKHINEAVSIFRKSKADSLISVARVGAYHPARMYKLSKTGYLLNTQLSEKYEGQNKQTLEKIYIRNGAIYIFKKKNLENNTIRGKKSLSYIMDWKSSINIDSKQDLEIAKLFYWKKTK